jgi:hypothetical protein
MEACGDAGVEEQLLRNLWWLNFLRRIHGIACRGMPHEKE